MGFNSGFKGLIKEEVIFVLAQFQIWSYKYVGQKGMILDSYFHI